MAPHEYICQQTKAHMAGGVVPSIGVHARALITGVANCGVHIVVRGYKV